MKDVTKEILSNSRIKAESAVKYIAGDAVIKTVKRRSQQEKLYRAGQEIAQALKQSLSWSARYGLRAQRCVGDRRLRKKRRS